MPPLTLSDTAASTDEEKMPTSAPITSSQATENPTSTSKAGQATENPTSKAESAKVHCLFVIALSSAAAAVLVITHV